jgi:hypothetical protein
MAWTESVRRAAARYVRLHVVACAGLAVSLIVDPAFASEPDRADARALFVEGRNLAAGGLYAEACAKFEASYQVSPGKGTKFNLADCFEHLGRTASAWARFLEVAEETRAAGQTDREQVARARAAALEPRLSRLTIEIEGRVDGLVVRRDGIPVTEEQWGIAVPVDPGVHAVEAEAPARPKWSARISVPAFSAAISVTVPLLEDMASSPPLPPPPPLALAPTGKPRPIGANDPPALIGAAPPIQIASAAERSTLRTGMVVALGALGVAALATGAVLALKMEDANGSAKEICVNPSLVCTQDDVSRHDRLVTEARHDRVVALVGAGLGAAAVATAAYLWWGWPGRAGHGTRASARLLPGGSAVASVIGGGLSMSW